MRKLRKHEVGQHAFVCKESLLSLRTSSAMAQTYGTVEQTWLSLAYPTVMHCSTRSYVRRFRCESARKQRFHGRLRLAAAVDALAAVEAVTAAAACRRST